MTKLTDKQLRKFVLEYFDEDELHTFCFDYFRDVRHQFGSGMSFNEKVMELIDYCGRNGVRGNFLEALKLEKEKQFNTFFSQNQEKAPTAPPVYDPQPRNPRKIFVSHSSEDGKLAQQIAHDLQKHGYDIFITPTSIRAGEKWVDAIMRGLDECGIFLVLLTPNAIESGWVRQETNTAIALNNGNKARLLFLHVEECQPPTLWQQWQYLSFRNKDYKENLTNLLRELKGETPLLIEVERPEAQPVVDTEEQAQEAQVAALYQQLLQAQAAADWLNVVMLSAKIELLAPDYRDVAAFKAAAVAHLQAPKPQPETDEEVPALEHVPEAVTYDNQCQGVTNSGQPCHNNALPGSEYCGVHAKQQNVAEQSPPKTKKQKSGKKPLLSEKELLEILGQYKDKSGYHLYPDISSGDQAKIRKRLELLPKDEEILAFIVVTMWGSVNAGMAFTTGGIVWRNDRFMSTLSDYSLHGQIPYEAFPETAFFESESSEINLGEGLGFNHAGWCDLSTEQILGLLDDIKKLAASKS